MFATIICTCLPFGLSVSKADARARNAISNAWREWRKQKEKGRWRAEEKVNESSCFESICMHAHEIKVKMGFLHILSFVGCKCTWLGAVGEAYKVVYLLCVWSGAVQYWRFDFELSMNVRFVNGIRKIVTKIRITSSFAWKCTECNKQSFRSRPKCEWMTLN